MQSNCAITRSRDPASKVRAGLASRFLAAADQLVDVEFFGSRALCELVSSRRAGQRKKEAA